MHLDTQHGKLPVKIRKGRGNRLKMFFTPDKQLVVETPQGRYHAEIDVFLQKNLAWIEDNYSKSAVKNDKRGEFLANLATHIPYLGNALPIHYQESTQCKFKVSTTDGIEIHCPADSEEALKHTMIRMAMERLAEHYLKQKVQYWAKITQSAVNKVFIKAQKTRWGSCSTQKNINLNWHIVLLEEKYVDYLIIHELMHLREMNHSPKFWQQVAGYCPDYQAIDKSLNQFTWLINVLP